MSRLAGCPRSSAQVLAPGPAWKGWLLLAWLPGTRPTWTCDCHLLSLLLRANYALCSQPDCEGRTVITPLYRRRNHGTERLITCAASHSRQLAPDLNPPTAVALLVAPFGPWESGPRSCPQTLPFSQGHLGCHLSQTLRMSSTPFSWLPSTSHLPQQAHRARGDSSPSSTGPEDPQA